MREPVNPPPDAASVAAGHELRDVRATTMVAFAVALTALVVLACALVIWLFDTFEGRAERQDPVLSPLAESQAPPDPRLQTQPRRNLEELRAAEERSLARYRWIDKEQGIVQIPVERAMELVAEEGLPAPESSPSAAEDRP